MPRLLAPACSTAAETLAVAQLRANRRVARRNRHQQLAYADLPAVLDAMLEDGLAGHGQECRERVGAKGLEFAGRSVGQHQGSRDRHHDPLYQ